MSKNLEQLETELQTALAALGELRQEQALIGSKFTAAAAAGDALAMADLRNRAASLPEHIFAAELSVARLELSIVDNEIEPLRKPSADAKAALLSARGELEAQQKKLGELAHDFSRADGILRAKTHRRQILALEIERKVAGAAKTLGPVSAVPAGAGGVRLHA